jgi:hypothetical protein
MPRNKNDNQDDFIPKEIPWEKLPKETREFTSFLTLVIEETIENMPKTMTPTWIRCFRKGCTGIIETSFDLDADKINWRCTECVNAGVITGIFDGNENLG